MDYISGPVKTAARYAIHNPISSAIHNSIDNTIDAARFAREHPRITAGLYVIGYGTIIVGGTVMYLLAPEYSKAEVLKAVETVVEKVKEHSEVVIVGGTFFVASMAFLWAAGESIRASDREYARRTTIQLKDSMEEYWVEWEKPEYTPRHPLRRLDRHPDHWEPAIKAADELGRGQEFLNLVQRYRAEVGTTYLEKPKAVRVNNKDLEKIIRGTSQTT